MQSYKQSGFVNSNQLFEKAITEGYAVPAYNFENMEQMQAAVQAGVETKSPIILQISKGAATKYVTLGLLNKMASGAVDYAKELGYEIPIVLHLDHGLDFEICKQCIDSGFSSVMIDGSSLEYKKNIELTKRVVTYAHQYNVSVEGELGVLSGIEDDVKAEDTQYTRPDEVEDFVTQTGVDSLAIAIGTSHGANKFKPEQCTRNKQGILIPPPLRFDILKEIEKRLPNFPIVLHGSSSVPQDMINILTRYSDKLKDSVGIPDEQLRKASKSNVCKINVASDGRIVMTAVITEFINNNPGEYDPRKYLLPVKNELKKLYIHKIKNVMGSDNKC